MYSPWWTEAFYTSSSRIKVEKMNQIDHLPIIRVYLGYLTMRTIVGWYNTKARSAAGCGANTNTNTKQLVAQGK